MISEKVTHPRFDAKTFNVKVDAIQKWEGFFTGQPKALCEALKALAGRKKNANFTGEEIRRHMEKNRRRFFEGTEQRDIIRVFQGYRSQLERAGVIEVV